MITKHHPGLKAIIQLNVTLSIIIIIKKKINTKGFFGANL